MKYSFLIFVFVLTWCCSFAQQLPDGALGTQSYIAELIKNYNDENAISFNLNAINSSARIPVRLHIIKNSKGFTGVDLTDIRNSLSTANTYFKNIGIQFFIDSVNYINDYKYSFIANNYYKKELLTLYTKTNMINLFVADSVKMGTDRCYGFTYFPDATDSNYIFLDKEYAKGKFLTTQLGHFMGLLSTHESAGGIELASEKNCSSSGDFICDTWADPDLLNQVDTACYYTGSAKDANGKYYIPTVANIMSNSTDTCKCIFTTLQYRRMYYYYLKYRQSLGIE